MRSVIYT
jgi:hypothetical protein